MKLVKITSLYPSYIQSFYGKRPDLAQKPFAEQRAALDYDGFGWADFWSHALRGLGYEAAELRANVPALQKQWAREQGITCDSANWLFPILKAQILSEKPDILFVDDYDLFRYDWLMEVRRDCPSIRLVIGWCGAPFSDASVFKAYDAVLSNIPALVDEFKKLGHRSIHLHHAFDPRILERIKLDSLSVDDLTFIGGIVRTKKFHRDREKILEQLVSQLNLRIYSPSAEVTTIDDIKVALKKTAYVGMQVLKRVGLPPETMAKVPKFGKIAQWTEMPAAKVSPILKPHMRPGVYGLEMFQTLRNSKVTFNSHIDLSGHHASNMRLFEATGVGTCLITDWKENLPQLFDPENEIVTYRSPDECIEKAKWLLAHPNERAKIAQAGQKRVLQEHTFELRARRLDELIRQWMKK